MKENLTLSAQRAVEERKKILEQQINRLQGTNISGIQKLKDRITPIANSLRELLLKTREVRSVNSCFSCIASKIIEKTEKKCKGEQ
jgi:hypothetical protein